MHGNSRYVKLDDVLEAVKALPPWVGNYADRRADVLAVIEALPTRIDILETSIETVDPTDDWMTP